MILTADQSTTLSMQGEKDPNNKVLQIRVMFNNKEVNNVRVANESFCQLQRQKFRQTLTPRIFWSEEKCYKTCKSFVTPSSFLSSLPTQPQ